MWLDALSAVRHQASLCHFLWLAKWLAEAVPPQMRKGVSGSVKGCFSASLVAGKVPGRLTEGYVCQEVAAEV